jgi:dihydrofolate synthase/folylpolyglutamate synthase
VREIAASLGAPLKRLGIDFEAEATAEGLRFRAGAVSLDLPAPRLRGAYQFDNLATGLAAVLQLLPEAAGQIEALSEGLRSVRLAGRFEQLSERPALWIDVGHNPLAARAVAASLRELIATGRLRRCRCVIAMLADKNPAGVASELAGVVTGWYCAPTAGSRAQPADRLSMRLAESGAVASTRTFDSVGEALEAAMAESAPEDGVLVFGSFLTAAEAGSFWRSR